MNTLMFVEDIELIEINKGIYEIRDKNGLIMRMEGNFTEQQLQDQFNNTSKGLIII